MATGSTHIAGFAQPVTPPWSIKIGSFAKAPGWSDIELSLTRCLDIRYSNPYTDDHIAMYNESPQAEPLAALEHVPEGQAIRCRFHNIAMILPNLRITNVY
jgi:hypothetical protein